MFPARQYKKRNTGNDWNLGELIDQDCQEHKKKNENCYIFWSRMWHIFQENHGNVLLPIQVCGGSSGSARALKLRLSVESLPSDALFRQGWGRTKWDADIWG
jgi:hypothetical protein